MDRPLDQQFDQALEAISKRLAQAEQALNRNGFKQDEDGAWEWREEWKLKHYIEIHFPSASTKGNICAQALTALQQAEQNRIDAASAWIRTALPSLKFTDINIAPNQEIIKSLRTAEAMIEQLTQERDEATQRAQTAEQLVTDMVDELNANDVTPADPQLEQVVSQAKVRALWPDPKQANFTLDRRDPMSFQERHTEFKRRSTDVD